MKDYSRADLAVLEQSRPAVKKAVTIRALAAERGGVLETLEGPMQYEAGDFIATGSAGERWPIKPETFRRLYAPCPPDGRQPAGRRDQGEIYMKKPVVVHALQVHEPFFVRKAQGTLSGRAGDWLVQYAPGDLAVIAAELFPQYYELSENV